MCYQTVAILRVGVLCCASNYCLLECRVSSYAHFTYFWSHTCQWRSQRGPGGHAPLNYLIGASRIYGNARSGLLRQ